ncbi:sensor histidine kinase [Paenibacillus tuaregi]|uniref:sensor histidine kinase n=1 Tax=Paenibacillus tuaregi TaxID=1816681 RepID=UPI0009EE9308|nr:HAMP domain-containing sensor histidine kinase [Paenibacillus tuaregi]
MIDKIWTFLNAKKSIRGKMLWALVPSLLLAILVSGLLDTVLVSPVKNLFEQVVSFGYFIALFVFFFLLFTRPIVRYFKAITDGLKVIADGNLDYRILLPREDELGDVASNINQMADRLESQMIRERQLEQSKMELITSISHDLRTPLTSIIGYLNLLKTHAYDNEGEQERYIDNAFRKTEQLKKRIDDLFEYTRLTSSDVRLSLQEVDLGSLLEQMIMEFEPVAKDQGITVFKELPHEPVIMKIDIQMMVRALDNLLMNALKFSTRPGDIRVKLAAGEDWVLWSVENFGPPIPDEAASHLFERFYKVEPSRYDKDMPSGSGLGLSITRSIVELHQGQIWLEHNQGHYKFCIELDRTGVKDTGS